MRVHGWAPVGAALLAVWIGPLTAHAQSDQGARAPKALGPYACKDDRFPAPEPDEIIAACTAALNGHPGTFGRLNASLRRAEGYSMKGDDTRAIADFAAANEDSKFYGVLGERGIDMFNRRDYRRAIADLSEAVRLRPDYELARSVLGLAYGDVGEPDKAIALFQESLKNTGQDPYTYVGLGYAYLNKAETAPALEAFDKAIKLKGDFAPAFKGRSVVRGRAGDIAGADADLDAAIRYDPKQAAWLNERCLRRVVAGRELDGALKDCNAALALKPHTAAYLDTRGFVEIRLGRWKDAIQDFNEALKAEPGLATSLYMRGLAKLKTGDEAAGHADMASAERLKEGIGKYLAGIGIEP
jgi:tetratricopeptide (TPR) repeat protein